MDEGDEDEDGEMERRGDEETGRVFTSVPKLSHKPYLYS